MKSTQIVEKVLTENAESPQVIYIFVRKIQIFDVFDDLFQTGHDGVAVFYRILPEKYIICSSPAAMAYPPSHGFFR